MTNVSVRIDWRYLLLIFIVVLTILLLSGYTTPIPKTFDAAGYWGLAGHFVPNGRFSLLAYDSSLRGYLYPLLLIAPRVVAYLGHLPNGVMEIFLGAVQAALLFGWLLPALYAAVQPTSVVSLGRRVAFAALGLFFWIGYFAYTLSDFPATLAFSGALLLLLNSRSRWGALIGAGVLTGAALNTRPFYLLSMPIVLLLAANLPLKQGHHWGQRLRNAALILAGIALPLIPQLRINQVRFGRNTPLVLTQFPKGDDLFLTQLGWGLTIQKYETALGSAPGGRNAQVFYKDHVGEALLVHAGYQLDNGALFKDIPDYIRFVMHHPIAVSGIYLTHIFNGLDQHHNTLYIRKPVQRFTWLLPVVNYSLWFSALLLVVARRRKIKIVTYNQLLVALAWLVPCSVACIVAIENRFLLPVHLLLYAVVCFEWKRDELLRFWREQHGVAKALLLGTYGIFVSICLAFSWFIHQQQYFNWV